VKLQENLSYFRVTFRWITELMCIFNNHKLDNFMKKNTITLLSVLSTLLSALGLYLILKVLFGADVVFLILGLIVISSGQSLMFISSRFKKKLK